MYDFGVRLKEERARLGVTQDEIAKLGGIAKPTYCNYEAGSREPGASFLAAIATAGADLRYIITGVREEAEQTHHGLESEGPIINTQMVLDVLVAVEHFMEREGYHVKPEKKALLVRLLCEWIADLERVEGRKTDRKNLFTIEPFKDLIRLAL